MNFLRGTFIKTLVVISVLLIFTLLLTVMCWDAKAHFSGIDEEKDKTLGQKVMNRMYFAIGTMSTTGFGDIVPVSRQAQAATMGMLLLVMINIVGLIEPIILLKMFVRKSVPAVLRTAAGSK